MAQNEKNYLIKRLLYAVAIVRGKDPTYSNVYKEFSAVTGFRASIIPDTNINKWMFSGNNPTGDREALCIKCINSILFGDGENSITDFKVTWESIILDADIKQAVEAAILKKDKLNFKHVLLAPDYSLDPSHLMVQIKNAKYNEQLKAHLLYHSPRSADIWELIKQSVNYTLYSKCQEGLSELLKTQEWQDRLPGIDLVFNFGAGSASKDKLILTSANKCINTKVYVWVDASLYMLLKTIKDVNPTSYENVNCVALAVDFEQPARLRKIFTDSFPQIRAFDKCKAFFILGFTLSNLDEESFFHVYKQICSKGDLFVFPMQFIPENGANPEQTRKLFENKLISAYDFEEGHLLAEAWSNLLEKGYSLKCHNPPKIERCKFNNADRSMSVTFSAVIKDQIGCEKTIITARSVRHYRSDYINYIESQGFKLIRETDDRDGVTTLLIEFSG